MGRCWMLIALVAPMWIGTGAAHAATPGAAPTNLRADRANGTQIRMIWVDNSTNETGFRIERKRGLPSDAGSFSEITSVAANITRFFDTPNTPETFFTYRVRGSLSGGAFTNYSNVSAASTAPAAPTNLRTEITGSRPTGQVIVRLTWVDNSSVETGFRIERREATAPANAFLVVGNAAANATTAIDPTPDGNTNYVYRVRAKDADLLIFSTPTNEVAVRTSRPSAPASLVATAVSSSSVRLTWSFASTSQSGFTVRRRTAVDAAVEIADVGPDILLFNDTNVTVNTTYFYTVVAFNGLGDSLPSNEDSATVLAAPTALTARALNGTQVLLAWSDNSLNLETGFEVFRSRNQFKLPRIATTGANVREFADSSSLEVNSTYFYRVRARNNTADLSSQTGSVSVTTLENPAEMTALSPDSESVILRWRDRSAGETGFKIERKPAAPEEAAEWVEIATAGANVTGFVDTTHEPGMRYTYRVRAFNDDGFSEYCPTWPTLVPLAAPEITETARHGLRVVLIWQDVEGEDGYIIERRVGNGPWEVVGTRGVDQTRFVDTIAAVLGRIRYRLRATNPFALSSYSEIARIR